MQHPSDAFGLASQFLPEQGDTGFMFFPILFGESLHLVKYLVQKGYMTLAAFQVVKATVSHTRVQVRQYSYLLYCIATLPHVDKDITYNILGSILIMYNVIGMIIEPFIILLEQIFKFIGHHDMGLCHLNRFSL